jgi:hypothetical protein
MPRESPHYRGSYFKRMVGEVAQVARRKDIVVLSPLRGGGADDSDREKTAKLITEAGCVKRGRRSGGGSGGGGDDSSGDGDSGSDGGGAGGGGDEEEEDRRELGGVVAVDTFTCG